MRLQVHELTDNRCDFHQDGCSREMSLQISKPPPPANWQFLLIFDKFLTMFKPHPYSSLSAPNGSERRTWKKQNMCDTANSKFSNSNQITCTISSLDRHVS